MYARSMAVASICRALVAAAAAACLASCGSSAPSAVWVSKGDLKLSGAWVAATKAGAPDDKPGSGDGMSSRQPMSVGYATISDVGRSDDTLVGVSTDAAAKVQLHNTLTKSNGSAGTMVQVRELRIPAGGSATLKPGAYHLMLMQLRHDLVAGKKIDMRFTFSSGTTMNVTFPIIDRSDRPGSGS